MLTRELTVTQELTKVKEKDIKDFEVTAYVLKNQVLFSQGKWKDYFYDETSFNDAFDSTDWNDTQVTSLFLDHYDGTPDSVAGFIRGGAATWVGDVKNIRKEGKDLIGDLYIVDLDTANKIAYPGSQWGVSAKLDVDFDEKNKGVSKYSYKNFSIVVEPAVKTAYINNTEADDRFAQFVKKIAKEVLNTMTNEKEVVMGDNKKWIQKAVPKKDEGKFEAYCKKAGFSGVSQTCINHAIKEGGHAAKMANFAINVSKGKYHHPSGEHAEEHTEPDKEVTKMGEEEEKTIKKEEPAEEPKVIKEEPKEEPELSEENLSELEKAAKLVLEFISKHKVEHQEDKPEEKEEKEETVETGEKTEEETPKEEPKEEEKKEEGEPEPEKVEKVENKDTEKLVKAVEQLSIDINKLKKEKNNSREVENVETVADGGICFNSETDLAFCNYLKTMIKED